MTLARLQLVTRGQAVPLPRVAWEALAAIAAFATGWQQMLGKKGIQPSPLSMFPAKLEELAVITVLKSLSKSKSSTNIASWASS